MLTEKTANTHNIKRAEVLAAAGIQAGDVKYAHPKFMGAGGGNCSLCGQQHLKWLYQIHFAKPDVIGMIGAIATGITRTEAVTFDPVGSTCIQDWVDAVPESADKLEALARWKREMDKERAAKTEQAIANYFEKMETSPALLLVRYEALDWTQKSSLTRGDRTKLRARAHRMTMGYATLKAVWGSVASVKLFYAILLEAEARRPRLWCRWRRPRPLWRP